MSRTTDMCLIRTNLLSVPCGSLCLRIVIFFSLLTFLLASAVNRKSEDTPSQWSEAKHYTHAIQRSYIDRIRPDAQLPAYVGSLQEDEDYRPEDTSDNAPLQRLRRSSGESYGKDRRKKVEDRGEEDEEEEVREAEQDQHARAQHFFPSFSPLFSPPPLGHSRPSFYNQESAFSQRPTFPGGFRDLAYPHAVAESESTSNVLGSGNFGVLRGGTFFAGEGDDILSDDLYSPYFHGGNNGHGRPSFYPRNPQPNYRPGDDFFANFRDFADISTPTKSSYSQYYVVYARQNASNVEHSQQPKLVDDDVDYNDDVKPTVQRTNQRPRNIIEQLSMLESAPQLPQHNKLSKRKLKLHSYKKRLEEKQNKVNVKPSLSPKDIYDPLLALS